MESPSKWPKKSIQYDYSIADIERFFEEQNEKLVIKEIIYKIDGSERTKEEIKMRMEEIKQGRINEPRWKEMNEGKIYLQKAIMRYFKWKSKAEQINEVCSNWLPEYIKNHIDILIKEKTIQHKTTELGITKNFSWMYKEFKNIFNEHKDTPLSDKEIIKKILKVFYNAKHKYEEELPKARIEYNDEMERREKTNDANDMYKQYEELDSPEITARKNTYEIFFRYIDPQEKFIETNQKIFNLITDEFERAKIIYNNKEKTKWQSIQNEKKQEQGKQEKKVEQLINKLNEPIVKSRVLIDNINPEYEEVDEEWDVIGLTAQHSPLFIPNDDNKKRKKDDIPLDPFD